MSDLWRQLLTLLLFAGALVGHFVFWIRVHNWLYGVVLVRWLSHLLRYGLGLAVLLAAGAFVWFVGLDLPTLFQPDAMYDWRGGVAVYLVLCWLTAFVLLPLITFTRLRHRPLALAGWESRVLDVAKELGEPPAGDGPDRWTALWPGNEVLQVELAERTLRLDRLPREWDGLCIAHLSDLHFGGTPDKRFFEYVMDRVAEWEPDLVALTGDVVDSKRHHRWVVPVFRRLRWKAGGFAILGNHDHWYLPNLTRRRLRKAGFRVLGNGFEVIEVRGRPMVVIGQEQPWFQPGPDLSDCPPDIFRLCLSHTPDLLPWAIAHGIDLMLAGHVHGGQIRIPLFGSVLVPSRYGRRFDCGTFQVGPTVLQVSRGLGGEHPIRYNCRPEVTRLILRSADGT